MSTEEMIPPDAEKTRGTLSIVFGRFNPPTTGHEKLLDKVAEFSDDDDYVVVPSRSQDKKKNPLDVDMKVTVMKEMFPKHKEKILNDPDIRTIFDVLVKAHIDGYTNARIVVGSDRVEEFDRITGNYNGKLYDFEKIEVMSAGSRDPDGEGLEGMSASKQRELASENNFDEFVRGVPTAMNKTSARKLFDGLRKGMGMN